MTEPIKAPWEPGWKPAPPPPPKPEPAPKRPVGNPAWTPGCPSPNPKGRPAGLPDKRLLATQAALDEMKNIVQMLVTKALDGDTNAASIVLAKVLPSVKAHATPVEFDYDADAPVSEQVSSVIAAISRGQVPPDVGRLVIESLKAHAEVRATEELEARIAALEEARGA